MEAPTLVQPESSTQLETYEQNFAMLRNICASAAALSFFAMSESISKPGFAKVVESVSKHLPAGIELSATEMFALLTLIGLVTAVGMQVASEYYRKKARVAEISEAVQSGSLETDDSLAPLD